MQGTTMQAAHADVLRRPHRSELAAAGRQLQACILRRAEADMRARAGLHAGPGMRTVIRVQRQVCSGKQAGVHRQPCMQGRGRHLIVVAGGLKAYCWLAGRLACWQAWGQAGT